MKILIVGGGIGGLAAGIALRRKGVEVEILEAAPQLTEVGAGIQIGANGTRVLRELGVEGKIAAAGVQPDCWEFRDLYSGDVIWTAPLKLADGTDYWGAPLYNLHRADLIHILASFLPEECIHLNAKVQTVTDNGTGVVARTIDGKEYRADGLVAADGIHSVVRAQLWGETEPRFAGMLMWRSLLTAEEVKDLWLPERGNYWTGPGRTMVTYWLRPQKLYSILATVPSDEVTRESWDMSGDVKDLRESFKNAEPRAAALIERMEKSFITGMFFRDPIEKWTKGRITLIGDAAHPMTPYYAQGATQSFEDVWVLAEMVERHGATDLNGAFERYEEFRKPRAARLQSGSRRMVKITHESEPHKIRARNGLWKGQRRIDPHLESDFKFVWGYNIVESLDLGEQYVRGLAGTYQGLKKKRPESQRALELWLSVASPENVARGYEGLRDGYEEMLLKNFPADVRLETRNERMYEVPVIRMSWPQSEYKANDTVVLHFHGGGYMIGSARGSVEYASRVLKAVQGKECVTVDYRLGPEDPYPAALDDAVLAYRQLLAQGVDAKNVILSGESSGAGLALAVALVARMAGDPMPKGVICVAPFADLTVSGETVAKFDGYDAAANPDTLRMMAEGYFQGHEPKDPLVSPVFADLAGMPPIYITASQDEVLYSDSQRIVENAKRAGVKVTERWVDDSVHIYPVFAFLPETESFLNDIAAWSQKL